MNKSIDTEHKKQEKKAKAYAMAIEMIQEPKIDLTDILYALRDIIMNHDKGES